MYKNGQGNIQKSLPVGLKYNKDPQNIQAVDQ